MIGLQIRNRIQLIVLFITLVIGLQFYLYTQQAAGTDIITIERPAGVEGFLPIGALMSWKQFILTGQWDTNHPAAMVIFAFAMVISLAFRKAFCSWLCPVGTLSEWLWKAGLKLYGKNIALPKWVDIPLRSLKYILLVFFLWVIGQMSAGAIARFIDSPYYKLSDVKMLRFFSHMTITTAIVLALLLIGSFFIQNFWCRYLCPYGALTGLLGAVGFSSVKRDQTLCTHCGECSAVCPHRIDVEQVEVVHSPECSGCFDCVNSCPSPGTLIFFSGIKQLGKQQTQKWLGTVIILFFVLIFSVASVTGHWQSQLPQPEFRKLLKKIDSPFITHPSLN